MKQQYDEYIYSIIYEILLVWHAPGPLRCIEHLDRTLKELRGSRVLMPLTN